MKTAEEFIREKIKEKEGIKGEMHALWKYQVSGEDCLRWSHEYAHLKLQEQANYKSLLKKLFKYRCIELGQSDYNFTQEEIETLKQLEKEV